MGGVEEETGISLMSILIQVRDRSTQHLMNTDETITQVTRDSESMRGGTRRGRTLLCVSACFVFV
jgi:hypothetical protein